MDFDTYVNSPFSTPTTQLTALPAPTISLYPRFFGNSVGANHSQIERQYDYQLLPHQQSVKHNRNAGYDELIQASTGVLQPGGDENVILTKSDDTDNNCYKVTTPLSTPMTYTITGAALGGATTMTAFTVSISSATQSAQYQLPQSCILRPRRKSFYTH